MGATVEGSGTVSFYWKVSSEENYDYLKFYLDGVYKDQISGEVGWQQKSYSVGSGTHSLLWKYVKDNTGVAGSDCGWVDYLQGPGTTPPVPDLLAQALDCNLSFTTGGSGGSWGTQTGMPYPYYGPDMAESSSPSDDQESWMQTSVTVNDGDKMSFYWKVSSESGADYLEFYIGAVRQNYISGNVDWQKKSYTFSGAGTKTLKWRYVKDSQNSAGQDKGWVDGLVIGSGSLIPPPDQYGEVLDCDLKFTSNGTEMSDTWYADSGTTVKYYLNGDSAKSYAITANEETCLQSIVESDSNETVKFYWKVSSEQNGDYLQFYIDSTLKDQISGEVGWQQKSYSVTAGTHILKWRYVKNSSVTSGDDTAWVDFVQWSGPSPAQDPADWQEIAYKHDVTGRRVEKKVDGYSTRYVYDGPHVIAEYDGNNNLLRKYIFGPGIDQPVSMIEVADANATYYYHFDALGSVVALSNAAGNTVQTYEYSVFGEVAVEDANHPNPYMFAGVRFDIEIGLYYNRARYYNPFTGRFLQTDPIGYGAGMNIYRYCKNNPLAWTDPFGLSPDPCESGDPIDPCDSTDPCDPCDSSDPCDPCDHRDPCDACSPSGPSDPWDPDSWDPPVFPYAPDTNDWDMETGGFPLLTSEDTPDSIIAYRTIIDENFRPPPGFWQRMGASAKNWATLVGRHGSTRIHQFAMKRTLGNFEEHLVKNGWTRLATRADSQGLKVFVKGNKVYSLRPASMSSSGLPTAQAMKYVRGALETVMEIRLVGK